MERIYFFVAAVSIVAMLVVASVVANDIRVYRELQSKLRLEKEAE